MFEEWRRLCISTGVGMKKNIVCIKMVKILNEPFPFITFFKLYIFFLLLTFYTGSIEQTSPPTQGRFLTQA